MRSHTHAHQDDDDDDADTDEAFRAGLSGIRDLRFGRMEVRPLCACWRGGMGWRAGVDVHSWFVFFVFLPGGG